MHHSSPCTRKKSKEIKDTRYFYGLEHTPFGDTANGPPLTYIRATLPPFKNHETPEVLCKLKIFEYKNSQMLTKQQMLGR
jgi:hypothetical protein